MIPSIHRHESSPILTNRKLVRYAIKIPATIFTWKEPASRPLNLAGAISEIYIGPTTEDAPTARPPIKRNVTNSIQTDVEAHPIADNRYNIAMNIKTFFRPNFCAGIPAITDPITVPNKLDATVKPCQKGLSDHNC